MTTHALSFQLISDKGRVAEETCRLLDKTCALFVFALHPKATHVPNDSFDSQLIHEVHHLRHFPAACTVGMFVDEEPPIFNLEFVQLYGEFHVASPLFPHGVPFFFAHFAFVEPL